MAPTPERIRAYREDFRIENVPPSYHGWRHLAALTTTCLAAIVVALARLDAVPRPIDLLALPASWLVANLVEYAAHRGPMHNLGLGLGQLYRRHTSQHHRFFSRAVMAIDGPRDVCATIFPAWMSLVFVAGFGIPAAAVLGLVIGHDLALLAYAGGVAYYLAFEWLHLSVHMPPESVLGRLAFVASARRHHAIHHDPAKMRRANFNFAIPLGDWLFGTWER